MYKALLISLVLVSSCTNPSTLSSVNIESCYDGDTCSTNTGEKIRLACFDTPELRGRNANPTLAVKARDHLRHLVVNQSVEIIRYDTDRYGRTVADLFVNGEPVGKEMVSSGHGTVVPHYSIQCEWSTNYTQDEPGESVRTFPSYVIDPTLASLEGGYRSSSLY